MDRPITKKKLSAVIACYRDGPAVPIMYERLVKVFEKLNVEFEIIFVNDCSPDNAAIVLDELANTDHRVVVITHTRNFGSQSAFTSGMRIATGDAVILLDGDLQDPPELIESFYQKWIDGNEVVYGIRVKREANPIMQVAYKLFYRVFHAMSYVNVPEDAGDFSMLDRKVVDSINALPENNRFIRGLRAWVGYKQTGIPYIRPERMFGRTTNSFLRNVGWAKKAIFSFSYVPLDFISWLSLSIVGISGLAIIVQIVLRLLFPLLAPSGFTTVIVLVLFVGGIQLFCLAIIGSYLSHIYDEVKSRPPYIVRDIRNNPVHTEVHQTTRPPDA